MDAIKIIDILVNTPAPPFPPQYFLVVDRMPKISFEKKGSMLLGEDSGFYKAYGYERASERYKAFGGAKFTIPMKDGNDINAEGSWWHVLHPIYKEKETVSFGYNTLEGLESCYVFVGGCSIDKALIDQWLANNEPGKYDKYDPRKNIQS